MLLSVRNLSSLYHLDTAKLYLREIKPKRKKSYLNVTSALFLAFWWKIHFKWNPWIICHFFPFLRERSFHNSSVEHLDVFLFTLSAITNCHPSDRLIYTYTIHSAQKYVWFLGDSVSDYMFTVITESWCCDCFPQRWDRLWGQGEITRLTCLCFGNWATEINRVEVEIPEASAQFPREADWGSTFSTGVLRGAANYSFITEPFGSMWDHRSRNKCCRRGFL